MITGNLKFVEGIKLHAGKLSSKSAEGLGFWKTLQERLQVTSKNPCLNCTRQSVQPSVTGVVAGVACLLRPPFNSLLASLSIDINSSWLWFISLKDIGRH